MSDDHDHDHDHEDGFRDYKIEALFDEHQSLSSFVEKEIVVTSILRGWVAFAWAVTFAALFAAGTSTVTNALVIFPLTMSFWLVDIFFSYYGVVYKMRRLRIRDWIDHVHSASADEMKTWKTPANPFDALGRTEKVQALRDTLTSPAVQGVYVILDVATLALLATV
jgi:hypothetical protein